MRLSKLFRLVVIVIFVALSFVGIFIYIQISILRSNIEQIVNVEEPLEKAVLEMEITATEISNAVLGYISSNDEEYKLRLDNLEKEFDVHLDKYKQLANTDLEKKYGEQILQAYHHFEEFSNHIVNMHSVQLDKLAKMQKTAFLIQDIPQYQLNNLNGYNPEKIKMILKLHKINEEVLIAMGSYIFTKDLKTVMRVIESEKLYPEMKKEFINRFPEEKKWFSKVDSNYRKTISLGYEIIRIEDDKKRLKLQFKTQLTLIDRLLDRKIQPIIKNKNRNLLENSRWTAVSTVYFIVLVSMIALFVFIFLTNLIRKIILKPVLALNEGAKKVSQGNFEVDVRQNFKNEIGELSETFTEMTKNLKQSFQETRALLLNNEEITEELSNKNTALEEAKQELLSHQTKLENTVRERTKELELERSRMIASLNYAKRIQSAMLPLAETFQTYLPSSFVLYKPRDIVSGDFYWLAEKDGLVIITAVDCTGHGVPGAFMSMIGNELLNDIVSKRGITNPAQILDELHIGVSNALHQKETLNHDGMDLSLCVIDKNKKILEFAGAKNPLVYIQDKELNIIKGDNLGIGGHFQDLEPTFKNHTVSFDKAEKPSYFYIFSDGYQDQFGGPNHRKKFMVKNLKKLLFSIHQKPMSIQKEILEEKFNDWMGNNRQLDDVLVIGFALK